MYVCRHTTTACMHAGSSRVAEYRSTRVANPLRGQLCTQTSVQLHLYTSGTNNHIPWAHRPISAQACVHTREITKIHQYMGNSKHPCTLRASLRLSMPNTVRVPSTACELKHVGHRTIGASLRLSMPNAVRVQVQRASPSARVRSVHRPGCPCHKTLRVQVRRTCPSTRAEAHSVHRSGCPCQKNCTCTSTACEPKHVGLRTIGASPTLSMPVHAAGLLKSVHCQAAHTKTLSKWHKHCTYVQAQVLMYTTHAVQAAHAIYCTSHAYTHSR